MIQLYKSDNGLQDYNVICPYCGQKYDIEYLYDYDSDAYTDYVCDECENLFTVYITVIITRKIKVSK